MGVPIIELQPLRYKVRVSVKDYKPPLESPVTVLVMLLKALGFEWYGAEKTMADGKVGQSSFLDTTKLWADGSSERKVVWNFIGERQAVIAGEPCGLTQIANFFKLANCKPDKALDPEAVEVLKAVRDADPSVWTGRMPFNDRGRRISEAAARVSDPEAKEILGAVLVLYRGFSWKLSTPIEAGPHDDYGWPLERHYRYEKGNRKGDVRMSISRDERMAELEEFKLI